MRTLAAACIVLLATGAAMAGETGLRHPDERHLANIRQLTSGGENAEAYFSADGTKIVFQSTRPPYECDQIFLMNADGSDVRLLSTGKGRTTCAFLSPDGKRVLYGSTHLAGDACPPPADRSKGYVWPLYPSFDIFSANLDGTGLTRLTDSPRYDTEGSWSPDGKRIVFTSIREGDLDIYTMNNDGSGVVRLTTTRGFDGGPFYSWDGEKIVYRSYYPDNEADLAAYQSYTDADLMRPTKAEIRVMDADGSNQRQVTATGDANWSPFMHPDGKRIIFSSNMHQKGSGAFSLYLVNLDGTGLERVTFSGRFETFPMFSKDGKKLIWCSTRNAAGPGEYNIFTADWVD
jgi:Tol biopolymer transport system component